MRPVYITQTGVGNSVPVPLDARKAPFTVAIAFIVTGTATYSLQHTYDDITVGAPVNWFTNISITNLTVNAEAQYTAPVRAVRLSVSAGSGSVQMQIIDASGTT